MLKTLWHIVLAFAILTGVGMIYFLLFVSNDPKLLIANLFRYFMDIW